MFIVLIYIMAIVAANLSVAHFGPWVSPINAFLFIGLDLVLRDHLHDKWRGNWLWTRMLALIGAAGAVLYLLNPAAGIIAVASVVAFVVSGMVDALVYHLLRDRSWWQRSNSSNAVGAMSDSLIFPAIAFGGFMPAIVALQFGAKVLGGAIWVFVVEFACSKFKQTSYQGG